MFEGFSKRDFITLICALIIVCSLSAWASIFVIKNYVLGERDDPLTRAGGLKPEQVLQAK
jgi:hypothetical protein